ncbi:uncharacterized protein TNCV_2709931 [Trichonephila clavipes]|nr:uncharacterized protein TNCV_2709931 [Trichonephila clavipes]
MHGQCPIGKGSWCYYQRALSCGKKPNEKYKGLSNEVLNTIKPTYLELCTKALLTKCLHGKTQNSNECLNGVIWQRVPKEVFVSLKILKSGALDAVIHFNDGYKGCVEIFKKLNITPGYFTLKAYKHLDINRINDAERHSTPNQRKSPGAVRVYPLRTHGPGETLLSPSNGPEVVKRDMRMKPGRPEWKVTLPILLTKKGSYTQYTYSTNVAKTVSTLIKQENSSIGQHAWAFRLDGPCLRICKVD